MINKKTDTHDSNYELKRLTKRQTLTTQPGSDTKGN